MNSADAVPQTVEQLEDLLSRPSPRAIETLSDIRGDMLLLGAGGKMGPTLARMAKRASQEAGVDRRVIAVSRFSDTETRRRLEAWGIETIACDLLDEAAVAKLPDAENVVAMTGFKFGAGDNPGRAWAVNCLMPAIVCRRFRDSSIVAFSSGNVYGLVPADSSGSRETDPPRPDGEYAMTVLGRERMYEFFSREFEVRVALLRLNYATELRYGVLVDIAKQVRDGQTIRLAVPRVNVIWQADANAIALTSLAHVASPPAVINVAGSELLDVEQVGRRMAELMHKPVHFAADRGDRAYLNDGRHGQQLLGPATTSADKIIEWTAAWVAAGHEDWDKPTHFQTTSGRY